MDTVKIPPVTSVNSGWRLEQDRSQFLHLSPVSCHASVLDLYFQKPVLYLAHALYCALSVYLLYFTSCVLDPFLSGFHGPSYLILMHVSDRFADISFPLDCTIRYLYAVYCTDILLLSVGNVNEFPP